MRRSTAAVNALFHLFLEACPEFKEEWSPGKLHYDYDHIPGEAEPHLFLSPEASRHLMRWGVAKGIVDPRWADKVIQLSYHVEQERRQDK